MITRYKLYNNQVELVFDSLRHRYTIDGQDVPSVTTILSVIAKPQLIYWSANMAIDYVTEQIKVGVSYDEIELNNIFTAGRKAHTQKKTDAGTVGTFVHQWFDKYIKGEQPPLPVNEGIRLSAMKLMEWEAKHKIKFLASEQPIYSRKFGYAGTLDFICKMDGKLYVGDTKTSSGIYDEYKLQVASYMQARSEEYQNEKYAGILIVRIGKDGEFEFYQEEDMDKITSWQKAFNHALELKKVMDSFKKNYV